MNGLSIVVDDGSKKAVLDHLRRRQPDLGLCPAADVGTDRDDPACVRLLVDRVSQRMDMM